MNETTATTSTTIDQFTWRRLSETFKLGHVELPPWVWVLLLTVLLIVALFYVMWMYIKDSTGRGSWAKAVLASVIAGAIITPMYVLALYVLGPYERDEQLWSAIAIAASGLVLGVVTSFVIMALISGPRDGGVGPVWGTILATLRLSVYTILMVVFLLPARQRSTTTSTESRVIVVFDVSDSLQTSDVQSTGDPNEKLVTRMERVIDMLQAKDGAFLAELLKKNPVSLYRLGARLDSTRLVLNSEGMRLTSTDPGAREENRGDLLLERPPLDAKFWGMWLRPRVRLEAEEEAALNEALALSAARSAYEVSEKAIEAAESDLERKKLQQDRDKKRKELDDAAAAAAKVRQSAGARAAWVWQQTEANLARSVYARLHRQNDKARGDRVANGTNLGDSLLGVLNREGSNRIQGIVVVTDGRNTEGSPTALRDLRSRAAGAKVPLFVVGVGEDRRKVKIEIADLRVPAAIQPEDKFRVVTEITGEGLPGEKLGVTLEITHTRPKKVEARPVAKAKDKPAEKGKDKPAEKGKDDKTKPGGKEKKEEEEEELEIELIERDNPDAPKPLSERRRIKLGKKLVLEPPGKSELDKGTPPRLEIEWPLDAEALALAVKPPAGPIDLKLGDYKDVKWELAETFEDSELKFRVVVPADKRELKKEPHQSDKIGMKVIKKPVRVLLVASAANRDYQFVRTLLVREMSKKQMELTIHLQLPPGVNQYRPGVVQDVPPDRLLTEFPRTYGTVKGDPLDLSSYDVIVAFDADWLRLAAEQIKMINSWSIKGGGLVMIGGHINTVELVRPREAELEADRFKPLLDLLPVVLGDRREFVERKTDEPWPLDFSEANPNTDFLRLDETPEAVFAEDWAKFFYGEEAKDRTKPIRGIFNFYPVQKVITGSQVLARYGDPNVKLKEDGKLHPYMVANDGDRGRGRVVWIGSAETWRLREYKEGYHERFWTKLVKFAAGNSKGAVVKPIRLEVGKQYLQDRDVEVVAKIDGPDGNPLPRSAKPRITLKLPPGVDPKEIKQPVLMDPRPGAKDGWFSARFRVRSPGEYEMTLTVPQQPGGDSEQSESAKFMVKESNPETDNTRPDYDLMYRLASEADDVLRRMSEADRNELRRRLQRPKLPEVVEGGEGRPEPLSDKLRLYFDLGNAHLIPTCMIQDVNYQTSKGGTTDLWDGGLTVWTFANASGEREREPVKVSYVLLLVVGLLSLEWLIRKLLRLA